MEELTKTILKNKPNLSPSSLKTYLSTLTTLYRKVFEKKEDYLLTNFNNTEKILDHIKSVPASRRKSTLSALVVLTLNEKYKTEMMSCISQHNQVVSKQEQNEKQKENNVSIDEMSNIYDDLTSQAKFIYKKKIITGKDHQLLQDYILISLMNGNYIPPRRSMDWTEFKLYNTEQAGCNYMDGNQFIFNTYKGSGSKGQQKINIPNELKAIIDKYRKVSENEYLFYDLNDSKMNSGKITKKLNKIYGKKFSVNGMRHAYMSNKYSKTIETNNAIAEDLKAMGSSALQSSVYINKIEK